MARLFRAAQNTLRSSSSSKIQFLNPLPKSNPHLIAQKTFSTGAMAETSPKSPLEANIVRILRNEIKYQFEYAPYQQPVTQYKSFTVQDHPGEQWITMRGKFGNYEEIKIEVTMFDGYEVVPKPGDDDSGEDVRLHISLLVDISKGDESEDLEFICSAWPDCLEVQNVYILRRDKKLARPYMGPDIRKLNLNFQKRLGEFLEARGINDELSFFLHDYMMNKDRAELVGWLKNVKSFVEKTE